VRVAEEYFNGFTRFLRWFFHFCVASQD
jgi:hypothetical protein